MVEIVECLDKRRYSHEGHKQMLWLFEQYMGTEEWRKVTAFKSQTMPSILSNMNTQYLGIVYRKLLKIKNKYFPA